MHPDWVPSLLMGHESKRDVASPIDRYKRAKLRSQAVGATTVQAVSSSVDVGTDSFADSDEESIVSDTVIIEIKKKTDVAVQTDLIMEHIDKMSEVINKQTVEICNYRQKLNSIVITEESFKDEKKTKFYMGLENFQILILIYNLIACDLSETPQSSLTKFQQLILTLQCLRLNLSLTDLPYRYGVCTNTASKIFQTCLYIMGKKLKRFVLWPERKNLWKTMPSSSLDSFGRKVAVITDCFEIKTEKPSNL